MLGASAAQIGTGFLRSAWFKFVAARDPEARFRFTPSRAISVVGLPCISGPAKLALTALARRHAFGKSGLI
jgi:hypothetical protein